MIKIVAVWFALLHGNGVDVPHSFTEAVAFDSVEACRAHVAAVQDRVADFVRGRMNAHWSVAVDVRGDCVPAGRDA